METSEESEGSIKEHEEGEGDVFGTQKGESWLCKKRYRSAVWRSPSAKVQCGSNEKAEAEEVVDGKGKAFASVVGRSPAQEACVAVPTRVGCVRISFSTLTVFRSAEERTQEHIPLALEVGQSDDSAEAEHKKKDRGGRRLSGACV